METYHVTVSVSGEITDMLAVEGDSPLLVAADVARRLGIGMVRPNYDGNTEDFTAWRWAADIGEMEPIADLTVVPDNANLERSREMWRAEHEED